VDHWKGGGRGSTPAGIDVSPWRASGFDTGEARLFSALSNGGGVDGEEGGGGGGRGGGWWLCREGDEWCWVCLPMVRDVDAREMKGEGDGSRG